MPHEFEPGRERREGRPASTTRVWGVLGGIASGKSSVARLLAGPDGLVIDADRIVAEHSARPEFRERVARSFGPAVQGADGAIDRAALAARVFDDPEARRLLESFVHPGVRAEIVARLDAALGSGVPRVVLDVPLLLENEAQHRLTERCDALIFVDAPASLRDARAVQTRGWNAGEVARRESQQMPLAEKRARAAHVLVNAGDRARLEHEVQELLRSLEHAP
ncbi:MAG TPA: dephospho-CoA kinase [Planctomycetota bacterium]|nr:dephospho-CoA kinase [Planctomycetota bacterium]